MSIAETRRRNIEDPPVFLLAVDAYHRMIEAGIFDEDDRVELINGELRAMPPIKAKHRPAIEPCRIRAAALQSFASRV